MVVPRVTLKEAFTIEFFGGVVKEGQSLDKADMHRNNHEATKLEIMRALNDEPGIDELIRNRHPLKHGLCDESREKWPARRQAREACQN